MTNPESVLRPPGRPLALGCAVLAAAIALIAIAVVAGAAFLDSGASSGTLVLDDVRAYAAGTVERLPSHNLYVVRLGDGSFLALDDLDAANRASSGRRCRVAPIAASDPSLPAILQRYAARFSAPAAGSVLIFREDCNGALYDVAGARLDANARNLDRYAVATNTAGHLTIDLARRLCTVRDGADAFGTTSCN